MLRLSHGRARHPSVAIVQTSHSALHRRHRRHHVAHEARPDNIRHDPGLGADTQVHVLVGFIGGYFVFKNISQLVSYQWALRGNTQLNIPKAALRAGRTLKAKIVAGTEL